MNTLAKIGKYQSTSCAKRNSKSGNKSEIKIIECECHENCPHKSSNTNPKGNRELLKMSTYKIKKSHSLSSSKPENDLR